MDPFPPFYPFPLQSVLLGCLSSIGQKDRKAVFLQSRLLYTFLSILIFFVLLVLSMAGFNLCVQGQDSLLKMRTFLKPASLGYGVNKQYKWGMGGVEEGEGGRLSP